MSKQSPRQRDQFIVNQIAYWKSRLGIDPELSVRVKYVTNNDPVEKNYAQIDRSMVEYGTATMEIFDEVFAAKDFEKTARDTIAHEMLHLALHSFAAFAYNLCNGNEGLQKEVERLEEGVVHKLQRAFTDKG